MKKILTHMTRGDNSNQAIGFATIWQSPAN